MTDKINVYPVASYQFLCKRCNEWTIMVDCPENGETIECKHCGEKYESTFKGR